MEKMFWAVGLCIWVDHGKGQQKPQRLEMLVSCISLMMEACTWAVVIRVCSSSLWILLEDRFKTQLPSLRLSTQIALLDCYWPSGERVSSTHHHLPSFLNNFLHVSASSAAKRRFRSVCPAARRCPIRISQPSTLVVSTSTESSTSWRDWSVMVLCWAQTVPELALGMIFWCWFIEITSWHRLCVSIPQTSRP